MVLGIWNRVWSIHRVIKQIVMKMWFRYVFRFVQREWFLFTMIAVVGLIILLFNVF